ncbi:glycoside hydrolase family 3 N-terminal domain-containing protein [Pontiella sulfatireligans]|uniref:Beta-glucosidase BoGH3B n=1 Tax=Pontiella sulfatireligans TaxID=2750658 RepID=A0A6C2UKQ9_9BACT|nr:glycoside hydrolase family 3 N-terminal domain-containing protein [Pontiella sulfatireligans]VGO20822.1 Beta-glucosidase BoGH3B [Pontiella sulfatireligans]
MKKIFCGCVFGLISPVFVLGQIAENVVSGGAVERVNPLPGSRPPIEKGFQPDCLNPSDMPEIYRDGWIDFNKDGEKDPYEDPAVAVEKRIDDLLSQMNVDEKTCQLVTLYGYPAVLKDDVPTLQWKNEVWKDGLANIDQHLAKKTPYVWPPSKHSRAKNETQRFFIEQTRLGIPVDFTVEGIHGLKYNKCTNFPEPLAVGASWNPAVAREIARITAREAKAVGYSNVYSPILDLCRDPRWGRVRESYSEDPFLAGTMGVATVKGMQGEGIAATAKHFAVYGIPKGGRDSGVRKDPQIGRREMQMLHLEPFHMVAQAGILGMMTSHNDYDGVPINASHEFLTDILRTQWGFQGYLVSDSGAVLRTHYEHRTAETYKEAIGMAVNAGLNVRTDFTQPDLYVMPMRELVAEGEIPMEQLDRLVRDVLRVKFRVGLFNNPYVVDPAGADQMVRNEAHRNSALEAARECVVLLKNENDLLPINTDKYKRILVAGPVAKDEVFGVGGYGPSDTPMVTMYDGLNALLPEGSSLVYSKGCDFTDSRYPVSDVMPEDPSGKELQMIDAAVQKAADADLAIVMVGDGDNTAGESRSRLSLNLPGHQEALIKAIQKTGTPTIVVLRMGRPASINWTARNVPAILCGWAMGEATGTAMAEALLGKINPGGKLPFTIPQSVGQIPLAFPSRPGSNCGHSLNARWLKQGFRVGKNRLMGPLYPFGFGLSYTEFSYANATVKPRPDCKVEVSVDVTNSGKVPGDEVVQCYLRDDYTSAACYEIMLKGFERLTLKPGETRTVKFLLDRKSMQMVDANQQWVVEPGVFTVMIGRDCERMEARIPFEVYEANGELTTRELKASKENKKPVAPGNRHKNIYQGELHKDEGRVDTARNAGD